MRVVYIVYSVQLDVQIWISLLGSDVALKTSQWIYCINKLDPLKRMLSSNNIKKATTLVTARICQALHDIANLSIL